MDMICTTCWEKLPSSAFRSYTHTASGKRYHDKTCRKCVAVQKRSTYQSDPEARAKQIIYSMETGIKRKHPNAWSGTLIASAVALILEQRPCFYCQQPNDGSVGFAVDHYVPLKLGGAHSIENLRSACEPCNRAKHDSPPEEYIAWIKGVRSRG